MCFHKFVNSKYVYSWYKMCLRLIFIWVSHWPVNDCNQIFQLMETNGPSIGGNRRFADVYICNMRVCALHQRKENSNDLKTIFYRWLPIANGRGAIKALPSTKWKHYLLYLLRWTCSMTNMYWSLATSSIRPWLLLQVSQNSGFDRDSGFNLVGVALQTI